MAAVIEDLYHHARFTLLTPAQGAQSKRAEKIKMKTLPAGLVALAIFGSWIAGQTQAASSEQDHAKHQAMEKRGNQGMGFAQNATTHHFLLRKDGGAIQVTANSSQDKNSIDEIHMHLQHIRQSFQSGDFNIPMFVHDQTPPGAPEMKKLKDRISYNYEVLENGGQVAISSSDPEAIKAIHAFLKFQITEHKTGDALEAK